MQNFKAFVFGHFISARKTPQWTYMFIGDDYYKCEVAKGDKIYIVDHTGQHGTIIFKDIDFEKEFIITDKFDIPLGSIIFLAKI